MSGDKKLCEIPVIHSDLILYIAFTLHKASILLLFLFTFRIVTFLKFVKRDDILLLIAYFSVYFFFIVFLFYSKLTKTTHTSLMWMVLII